MIKFLSMTWNDLSSKEELSNAEFGDLESAIVTDFVLSENPGYNNKFDDKLDINLLDKNILSRMYIFYIL